MESVDAEFLAETLRFIDDSHDKGVPFFAWFNSTRMHTVTHLSDKWKGKTGRVCTPMVCRNTTVTSVLFWTSWMSWELLKTHWCSIPRTMVHNFIIGQMVA